MFKRMIILLLLGLLIGFYVVKYVLHKRELAGISLAAVPLTPVVAPIDKPKA